MDVVSLVGSGASGWLGGFVEIVQLRAIFGSLIFDLISDGFLSS